MAFKLIKTATFLHACDIQQVDEAGKTVNGKLRVRFNKISRARWDEMTKGTEDDERLLFDVVVNKIEDQIDDGNGGVLDDDAALQAVREDLSLTGQVVDQGVEIMFGAAAKNARRSRGR